MELFNYLLKVTCCTAAFFVVYYLLLQKLTFFNLNRWYLLSSLTFSVAIPLLHIGVQTLVPASNVKAIIINTTTKTLTEAADPILPTQPQAGVNWVQVCTCIYLIIAVVLLLKLVITITGIVVKALKHGQQQNGYWLITNQRPDNSSFFKYIFLNTSGLSVAEEEQVIAHEMIHVQKLHSADNLFSEVLKALLWFNPFIYLFGKALCQAHEFDVDRCLADRYNSKNYAGLLLKLSTPANIGLANQFSAFGLKTRLAMLFNRPSAAAKKLSYLLLIPVMATLVYFLCVDKVYAYSKTNPDPNFVLVLDAGHGGKTTGAVASNGVTEKDLALSMVKQIKAIAEERGIKAVLTRNDDTDVSRVNRLASRGDVFVSVHLNSVGNYKETDKYNGILVLTDRHTTNSNSSSSAKLAGVFKDAMQRLNGIATDTATRKQGLKILAENHAPAILLELGYLSNKHDVEYITNKQNQHDVAEKFVDAVIDYKTQYWKK
jgi:N-acetylmuramoyl-L-alanine amidase